MLDNIRVFMYYMLLGAKAVYWALRIVVSYIITVLWRIIRLPIRFTLCYVFDHDWIHHGNGFFGMFAPRRPFECVRCGLKTDDPGKYKTRTKLT